MKNLNTTGTFREYIESIHAEIVRLLSKDLPTEGVHYYVETKDDEWINGQTKVRIPAKSITISDGTALTSLSIAKKEFSGNRYNLTRNSHNALNILAEVRFQQAIANLKDMVEGPNRLIERLTAPEPEMTRKESRSKLNTIADEINEAIGEKVLGEFMARPEQLFVFTSLTNIGDSVSIDFKEATGHRVKEIVIERTIGACDQMIRLLEQDKAKLARL